MYEVEITNRSKKWKYNEIKVENNISYITQY